MWTRISSSSSRSKQSRRKRERSLARSRLLMTQRLHGIDAGGAPRRNVAGDQGGREQGRRGGREGCGVAGSEAEEPVRDRAGRGERDRKTERDSGGGDEQRLAEHQAR